MEALISEQESERTFHLWDSPSFVNTASVDRARHLVRQFGREPTTITMQSRRLDSVLQDHLPPGQAISFLSVDVERHDVQVLRSNDWDRFRPELVLVEDHQMAGGDPAASEVYRFMQSARYDRYAWLRPTVAYREIGLRDWLAGPMAE